MITHSRVPIAFAGALATALVALGCGSGSGGSGGGSSGLSVAASTSSQAGPDLTPPDVTISAPARGAFLPAGPVVVTGNATDSQSGVATVTVQGIAATVDAKGNFTATVTLDEGVAPIVIMATDNAGNRTTKTISVETGNYVDAKQIVPGALAGRINSSGFTLMETIGAQELVAQVPALTASLGASPIYTGYTIQVYIQSITFGTPVFQITPSTAGLAINLAVPQINIQVVANDTLGFPITTGTITADMATINAVAQLGANATGGLTVQFPTATIDFQNFDLQLSGLLSFIGPIAKPLVVPLLTSQLQSMIQTQGPAAIASLVDQALTFTFGTTTGTFTYFLDGISTDTNGIQFSTGINLALAPDPTYPVAPGSLDTPGALPAASSTLPTAVISVSETAINRVFEQAWQSGFLATDVSPAALTTSFGVALPIGSTASDLVHFLPELQGAIPAQDLGLPIVYRIKSLLPPTAKIQSGVPDPLRLRFGEYEITASIDLGGGQFLDVFTVSMAAEIQVGVAIQNGTFVPDMRSLPNPKISADLISSPLAPIGAAYIESYLDGVLSMLLGGIIQQLPPIAVPALAGVNLTGATIHADGPAGSYLTVELEAK